MLRILIMFLVSNKMEGGATQENTFYCLLCSCDIGSITSEVLPVKSL